MKTNIIDSEYEIIWIKVTPEFNWIFFINKTIYVFCLQLGKVKYIFHEEFKRLNWLPLTYRFKKCVNSIYEQ